jgi:NADH-quinone oxidoreductase subunit I
MAKVVTFKPGLWEAIYIPELLRGMSVTLKHFFINTFTSRDIVTVRYPEEKRVYPRRFRGVHRLMQREDGTPRCVACMMCSTICPANCITIESGARCEDDVEKQPVKFEIDELLCVVCGLCVESCPCDAIRMDSGAHMPPMEARHEAQLDKEHLLARGGPNISVQGGAGPDWRDKYDPVLGDERAMYDKEGEYNKSLKGS